MAKKKETNPFIRIILLVVGYLIIYLGIRYLLVDLLHVDRNITRVIDYIAILIYLFTLIKKWKLTHILKWNTKSFIKGLIVGSLFLIVSVINAVTALHGTKGLPPQSPGYIIFWILVYLIGAGFIEEVFARGIIINLIKEKYKFTNKKNIVIAIITSGVIFGSMHLMNIISKGTVPIGQMLVTTGMGIAFATIYIRSKSLWSTVLLHGLWDICVGLDSILFIIEEEAATKLSMPMEIAAGSVFIILYSLYSAFLLRKKKIKECYEK